MKLRMRVGSIVAAAVGLVVPLVAAQPADAATHTVTKSAALTFVNFEGATITCGISVTASHNDDTPGQPYTQVSTGESGTTSDCFDYVDLTITLSYKDHEGVRRKVESIAFAPSVLTVQGTFSSITASLRGDFFSCDSSMSASCAITATASPK
jgi:hypothetical protein